MEFDNFVMFNQKILYLNIMSLERIIKKSNKQCYFIDRFCLKNLFYRRRKSPPTAQTKLAKQVSAAPSANSNNNNRQRRRKRRKKGGAGLRKNGGGLGRKKSKLQGPSGLIREKKVN